jgi:hypothetical protein
MGTKAEDGQLLETCLGWSTLVKFQLVVPLLGDTLHVKGRQQYLLIIGGSGHPEKLLGVVQP